MSPRVRCFALVFSVFTLFGSIAFAQAPVPETAAPPSPPPAEPAAAAPAPATPPPPIPKIVPPPPAPPAPAPPPPAATPGPLKVEGPGGTLRVGLLAQTQFQALGSQAVSGLNYNLYLRRIRLIVGGTILKSFDYFFETDYPNLFLDNSGPTGLKNTPGMNIQDAMITYKALPDVLKIDAGYMLPPLAHNSLQSAATLYSWDYFTNTFRSSDVFGSAPPSPVGRDLGVQARGLVMGGHVDYRVGIFQGFRATPVAAPTAPATTPAAAIGGRNFFRVTGRLQINLLDSEPGLFYAGTYLGARKILSFGGSYDFQGDYKYWAVDGIADLPLGPGVATAQVNVAQWNPGNGNPVSATALPKQTAFMGEAGYTFLAAQVSPIVRYERRQYPDPHVTSTESRYSGGLAFWPFGHTSNIKAFYTRVHNHLVGLRDFNQFNLQWQLFFY